MGMRFPGLGEGAKGRYFSAQGRGGASLAWIRMGLYNATGFYLKGGTGLLKTCELCQKMYILNG